MHDRPEAFDPRPELEWPELPAWSRPFYWSAFEAEKERRQKGAIRSLIGADRWRKLNMRQVL